MSKLRNMLEKRNIFTFIFLFVVISLVFMILFNVIKEFFNIPDVKLFGEPTSVQNTGIDEMLILGVILVPLLETFLFQKLPYWLLVKSNYFAKHKYLIILITAPLFGLEHIYSLHYIIYATCLVAIFMYAYILRIYKRPFWTVFGIHATFNLTVVILEVTNIMK